MMTEQEAQHKELLAIYVLPSWQRHSYLKEVEAVRGKVVADQLKQALVALWKSQR
jgi:hypothetical protein